MSYRTTYVAVGKIIDILSTYDSDSFEPFIESANALVTECCSTDDYDTTRLELIERWLSAHFYSMKEKVTVIEKAGPVSEHFDSQVDLGFDLTRHGQMALRLDTEGGLAALNAKAKKGAKTNIGISWLGDDDINNQDLLT